MTAIQLNCLECGELFWSNGFTHICLRCAMKDDAENPKMWEGKTEEWIKCIAT